MNSAMLQEIQAGGAVSTPSAAVEGRGSTSSAMLQTQHAINNLGGPVYASMTDHAPQDSALAQAKTLVAIQKGGEKSVSAAPVDRAIAESLTLSAITSGKTAAGLKKVETNDKGSLSADQLKQLQIDAQAEKDRKQAARTFGGGDSKKGMANILTEIQGQGGSISVPTEKAVAKDSSGNILLNQTKTFMEINSLKGEPVFASMQDHKVVDTGLAQAKTLIAIQKKGEAKIGAGPADRALNEAAMMMSISKKPSLKHVDAPTTALSQEKLKELQEQAVQERASTSNP